MSSAVRPARLSVVRPLLVLPRQVRQPPDPGRPWFRPRRRPRWSAEAKPVPVQSAAVVPRAQVVPVVQEPVVALQVVPAQVVPAVREPVVALLVVPVVKAVQSEAAGRSAAQPVAELLREVAPRVVPPRAAVRPVVLRLVAVPPWVVALRSVAVPPSAVVRRQPVARRSARPLPSWNRRPSVPRCSMPGPSGPCWPTPA
ncbi:hypothetical protein [Mycolicibacterium diernhoferi]|uniref:hypothetical protein n=1 Tax=Mycolicibacterium diernhoferi TaxID=1801 RepID=UPI001A96821E|nr:hypothetical protein [Mycolicibacterium diernhoferi]QYL21286.1 hypothetical protein K0O62_19960 [Mycolicibacterium diernhoferi]